MLQSKLWIASAESLGPAPCAGRFRPGPSVELRPSTRLHFSSPTVPFNPCDQSVTFLRRWRQVTAIVEEKRPAQGGGFSDAIFRGKLDLSRGGRKQASDR
ncbi:hypothetical protein N7494_008623 [Penicillium frequentans]|uniref:Uncharacterized protein n=1 Tax=Penicillium frequentans TaxID=3151616 RepID=A0AAD6GC10_9EURO|nr:hypothetical protein N7494_008623 [Penicillium glabrum]